MAASSTGKGQGNLDTVVLRHRSGASVEVYLFGATLCSYKTCDGKDQIFVSPGAKFDGKKAIRGGVPIVFPQFGQPDKAMAQHGFARISMWSLKEISDSADEARAVLTLSDSPETRSLWNHAFRLEYVVSLRAKSLKLTLCVVNTGSAPFDFNCLLHTYFRVPDVAEVSVRGLMGLSYIDKVDGGATKTQADAHACLPSCTDSVYVGSTPRAKDAVVAPKDGPAMFAVTNEAVIAGDAKPCDIVLWNPYEAASPGDLPPPAFKNFVCVEPGLVSKMYELPSKATAELSQTIVPSQACSPAAMPVSAMRLLLCRPKVPAPLDPNFAPVVLAKKNYLKFLAGSPHFLEWALPRADGCGQRAIEQWSNVAM